MTNSASLEFIPHLSDLRINKIGEWQKGLSAGKGICLIGGTVDIVKLSLLNASLHFNAQNVNIETSRYDIDKMVYGLLREDVSKSEVIRYFGPQGKSAVDYI